MQDARERILRRNFFPISEPYSRGYFEIVYKSAEEDLIIFSDEQKFDKELNRLAIGDEVAIRGGKSRLSGPRLIKGSGDKSFYTKQTQPLGGSHFSVVCAGEGVTPAVQILRYILEGPSYTSRSLRQKYDSAAAVEMSNDNGIGSVVGSGPKDVDFLIVTDDTTDSVFDTVIHRIKGRHPRSLCLNQIKEPDIYSPELMRSKKIIEFVQSFEPGKVAVICGPEHILEGFRYLYQQNGYSHDAIISVSTEM